MPVSFESCLALQHPGTYIYQPLGHSLPSLRACPWPRYHSQPVCSYCSSWLFQYSQGHCCRHPGLWSLDLSLRICPPCPNVNHSLPRSETLPQTIISISGPHSPILDLHLKVSAGTWTSALPCPSGPSNPSFPPSFCCPSPLMLSLPQLPQL